MVLPDLDSFLQAQHARHAYRRREVRDGAAGIEQTIGGRRYLNFCSNDYLGLAADPRVAEALREGARRYGAGAGAAALVCGYTDAHAALEAELAAFLKRPRALLFSSGYLANLGVLSALAGRGDCVYADRLSHASVLDGARLSGARLVRYAHGDPGDLQRRLGARAARAGVIASDGVFSMDGDLAPVRRLSAIAAREGAALVIDDAHGVGVLGAHGRGILEVEGSDGNEVPVLVGTFGKAFGTAGAFVAGAEALIEYLIQRARSFIYDTAMPPALAHATRTALRIVQEEPERRARLQQNVAYFVAGARERALPLSASTTPIQPLVLGASADALAASRFLRAHGLWVQAIRPPTVPAGTARLRITLSAAHTEAHIDRLLDALAQWFRRERPATETGT